jgi:hypothetical protein
MSIRYSERGWRRNAIRDEEARNGSASVGAELFTFAK